MSKLFHVELFVAERYLTDILGMAADIRMVRMIRDGENARDRRLAEAPIQAPAKAKPKRKPGRPRKDIPAKVLAVVRQLQDSVIAKNGGAPLKAIKNLVKSPSVSPVLTDLIKHKKLTRVSTGHYRVA